MDGKVPVVMELPRRVTYPWSRGSSVLRDGYDSVDRELELMHRSRVLLPHVGLVVPPSNSVAEPELHELLAGSAGCHTSRFPILPGLDPAERLHAYSAGMTSVLAAFGELRLEAVLLACTGSSYIHGPSADRETSERLADTVGAPVASAGATILARLEQLGCHKIVLASAYAPWLIALARGFWRRSDVNVAVTIDLNPSTRFAPYGVTTNAIVRAVRGARLPDDAAIVFSGTGLPTLDAIEELHPHVGCPLLSSNLCGAHWLIDRLP